jgi:predicted RNA-binding protein with PUA-like domain
MQYWLVKSEPGTYSFARLIKETTACWDGVRNYAARNHLRGMKKNDKVLFYHSGDEKAVVGVARVARAAYPDPTTKEEAWVAVDLVPVKALRRSVPLSDIRKDPALKNIPLLRIPRLSVMPLTATEFETLTALGG